MAGPDELGLRIGSMGAEETESGPASFKRSIGVDPLVKGLAANELELLADTNLELADRHQRAASFIEDEEGRKIALALSNWRRLRGQYFRELGADAQRTEAEHLDSVRARLRVPSPNQPEAG